jgi:hypothetical protein
MREVAARERAAAEAAGVATTPASPGTTSGLPSRAHVELLEICERWISHIWSRAEQGMTRVRRVDRKRQQPAPEPAMGAAPVVIHEPAQPLSADPKLAQHFPAPLIISDFSSAKIIPNSEFPVRYTDRTTENWKASILQNEQISKVRAERSRQLQNRNRTGGSRYIG